MARKNRPTVGYSTTLVDDGRDDTFGTSFHSGVPRENAVNTDRLAERALLQGAKSGLLDDRVAVDAEESKDIF